MFLYSDKYKFKNLCIRFRLFSYKNSLNSLSLTALSAEFPNFKIKATKPKKQAVTILRAPKHFKIGRHHFHTGHRLLTLTRSNFLFSEKFVSPKNLPALLHHLTLHLPKHPLTKTTSLTSTLSATFTFKI